MDTSTAAPMWCSIPAQRYLDDKLPSYGKFVNAMMTNDSLRHEQPPRKLDYRSLSEDITRCERMQQFIKQRLPLMSRCDVDNIQMVARREALQNIRAIKRNIDKNQYSESSDDSDVSCDSDDASCDSHDAQDSRW